MRRVLTAGAVIVLSFSSTLWVGGTPAAAQDDAPSITVTRTPGPGDPGCLPAAQGASGTITETETEVIVTVVARNPVCGDVTAAVYAMPNNRVFPWPQSKRESETFRITPGTTVIRFRKGCEPQQFDVVTGPTPQTIRPDTGPMHGPLLFEVPWTGIPHWNGCPQATTTTTSTTTTAPGATTSSTTTTVAAVVEGTSTTVPQDVEGVTQLRDGSTGTGTSGGSALATTGTDVALLARLAVILLALGGTLALTGVLRQQTVRRPARPRWLPES